MKVIVASHNKHKIKEFRELFAPLEIKDFSEINDPGEVIENGISFEQNALIKAQAFSEKNPDDLVVSDDSGICIVPLDHGPGIYSARYAGENADDLANNRKMIEELSHIKNLDERKAYYVCSICFIAEDKTPYFFRSEVHGKIAFSPSGTNGFGYDPYFIPDGYDKTFGEIDSSIKSEISHRAKALKKLKEFWG